MLPNLLTESQIKSYHKNGYLIVSGFLNDAGVNKLLSIATDDDTMSKHSYNVNDSTGKKSKLALWFTPGSDAYGLFTKSESLINAVNQLLDGDTAVCHFHSKSMQKEPRVGGAWEWHQDYGYWNKNEFLYPDKMISVMMAITKANKDNGCLQVIRGSHLMGRIEHGFAGEQVGASQHYVDLALKTMDLVYVEVEPGDALFFHSNLLHRSAANLSNASRWSLISCYNRAANVPYNEKSMSCITPLQPVPDNAMLEWETTGLNDSVDFLSKETDVALRS